MQDAIGARATRRRHSYYLPDKQIAAPAAYH